MSAASHDLFCSTLRQGECNCDMIRRVREDERSLYMVSREARMRFNEAYWNGFNDGVASLNGPESKAVSL